MPAGRSRGPSAGSAARSFQVGQLAEDLKAGVDFFAGQRLQALGAKTLHRKRPHHATVKERAFQDFAAQFSLRGDVPHEAASKGIACAGRILDFVEGQRGSAKGMTTDAIRAFTK